ncbi:hypothetical protein BPO_0414 [Bergeyella porcorum]|uniref:Uncharacterized protein n=1 Tax=Bergeyella porcorum TaxID=1735111 RepID=A0AAU0EZ32_9FLAO
MIYKFNIFKGKQPHKIVEKKQRDFNQK